MTREETFNLLATLLEEGGEIEVVSERIMEALEVIGEDLLDHLDPPVGLKHWLESHGLSLVVTSEITPPVVWEALQGEDVEPVEESMEIESTSTLLVGDYVEYQTATSGPRGQSRLGSGWITSIGADEDGGQLVVVRGSPTDENWIFTRNDFIRVISPPVH